VPDFPAFSKTGEHPGPHVLDSDLAARLDRQFEDARRALPVTGPILLLPERHEAARSLPDALDCPALASWTTADNGGNCFFASTHAALMLMASDPAPFALVSGRFGPFPGTGCILTHAWLEIVIAGEVCALNVSNMATRPGYVLPREVYFALNHCSLIHQSLPRAVLSARAGRAGLDPARHRNHGEKVRRFTKRIFAPTMRMFD